jgi:hypothetical protein
VKQIQFKNTSIFILIPEKVPYCSASWFPRKPKYVGSLHSNFFKEKRVITIDLLGHETECLGYVHTMEDNADAVHSVLSELSIRKSILAILWWLWLWLSPNCTLNM